MSTNKGDIITKTFPIGKSCQVPREFAKYNSKGELFAQMLKAGYSTYQISKITGVRFQQIRNQLINKGLWKNRAQYLKGK